MPNITSRLYRLSPGRHRFISGNPVNACTLAIRLGRRVYSLFLTGLTGEGLQNTSKHSMLWLPNISRRVTQAALSVLHPQQTCVHDTCMQRNVLPQPTLQKKKQERGKSRVHRCSSYRSKQVRDRPILPQPAWGLGKTPVTSCKQANLEPFPAFMELLTFTGAADGIPPARYQEGCIQHQPQAWPASRSSDSSHPLTFSQVGILLVSVLGCMESAPMELACTNMYM